VKFSGMPSLICRVLCAIVLFPSLRGVMGQISTPAVDSLHKNFENPPQEAKLRCYWWWLNGYTTVDTITRDLTEMKSKGYGGVILVDAYSEDSKSTPFGPPYGSPGWMVLYLHALELARSLGLEISLSITDGGNVGILGGQGVPPEDALKVLTFTRLDISGGSKANIKFDEPESINGFYRQIAVLAYPLRHGTSLAGQDGSRRAAIGNLPVKAAFKQLAIRCRGPRRCFQL
jgi:alpha-L-rhamnosidase